MERWQGWPSPPLPARLSHSFVLLKYPTAVPGVPFRCFKMHPPSSPPPALPRGTPYTQKRETPLPPHQGVCNAQYVGALRFQ
ncbi:uncharacterized protein ACIBXB_014026 isoform 2-T7 [Morphnus guianensis]